MSETIQSQYKILLTLKAIEEKIYRLSREAEELPKEISKIEIQIFANKSKYETVKGELEFSEKNLRRAELDLKEREEKLLKAQEKMMAVKTNEEYQAALKENETQKQEKTAYEEVVIRLMSEIEEKKTTAAKASADFKSSETGLIDEKKKCEEERGRVLKLMEIQIGERIMTIGQLSSEVAILYNRTLDKLKSVPIVVAESGRCTGCHMLIRPQLFNEILGFKAIHKCASCGRIIVLPELPAVAV